MMLLFVTLAGAALVTVMIGAGLSLAFDRRTSLWWPLRRVRVRMPRAIARVIARRERA